MFEIGRLSEMLKRRGMRPKYRVISAHFAEVIRGQPIPDGTPVPPTRVLERRLRVSRQTVLAAYEELKSQGLVRARVGGGTYVNRPVEGA